MSDSVSSTVPSEPEPNPFVERLTRHQWLFAGLILLAQLALLIAYGETLWAREHYQFFPIVLIGAVVLLVDRTRYLGPLQPGHWLGSLFGLALSVLLFAGMVYIDKNLTALATAIVIGLSLAYVFGGGKLLRAAIAPAILLVIIVRPPIGLDQKLITSMQTTVSLMGSHVLDVCGVIHALESNVIQLPEHKDLFVEQACSGIHSLFSAISVALFYAIWTHRAWYHTLALFIITIGWVMVANIARVSLIGLALVDYDLDLTAGWRHEMLGGVLFAACLLMIWSSDQFLQFVFGALRLLVRSFRTPDLDTTVSDPMPMPTVPNSDRKLYPILIGTTVVMLALGIIATYRVITGDHVSGITAGPLGKPLPIEDDELPKTLGGWKQIQPMRITTRENGGVYGDFSHTWAYAKDELRAEVSLDYPFSNWKDLTNCYINAGWIVKDRTIGQVETMPYHEVDLHKNVEEHSYLLFTQLRGNNVWLTPPTGTFDRISDIVLPEVPGASIGYQMQVFHQPSASTDRATKSGSVETLPGGVQCPSTGIDPARIRSRTVNRFGFLSPLVIVCMSSCIRLLR